MLGYNAVFDPFGDTLRRSLKQFFEDRASSENGESYFGDFRNAARIINTVDVAGARKVIERNFKALRVMLGEHYGDYVAANNAIKTILGGIGSAVERPLEVEHNWRIGTKEPWERDYSWLTASKKLSLRQQI